MEYQYVWFFLLKKKKKKKKKRKSCLLPMYTYVPPFFGMGESFRNSNTLKKKKNDVKNQQQCGNFETFFPFVTIFNLLFFEKKKKEIGAEHRKKNKDT